MRRRAPVLLGTCFGLFLLGCALVVAQPPATKKSDLRSLSGAGILDQLGGGGISGEQLTLTGEYKIAKGKREGRLAVHATTQPGWHTYSITQMPGGPMPSRITVADSPDFQLTRSFVADRAPHIKMEEVFPVPSEEFANEVIWTAPFRVAEGADPEKLQFNLKYSGQVCEDQGSCIPISNRAVEVKFAGYSDPPAKGEFQPKGVHLRLSGQLVPRTVMPGSTVKLSLTAQPTAGYHVYAYADRDPKRVSKPTLIAWKNNQGWQTSPPVASEKPVEHATGLAEQPTEYYHDTPVTWTIELQVPSDAAPGGYELRGVIGYQTCKVSCDLPSGAEFSAILEVAKQKQDPAVEPLEFVPASYTAAAVPAARAANSSAAPGPNGGASLPLESLPVAPESDSQSAAEAVNYRGPVLEIDKLRPVGGLSAEESMLVVLPMAFLAGFILNFMPCVLPVIGLKIVAFVHQAGQKRSHIFMLNFWYCVGLLTVFMVLASLAVFAGIGWGKQFQYTTFNIILACIVFAFALSFLGIWEIPLPGFVGSKSASKVAGQEGAVGAFLKGILTTVLATPCGGPLLVPAMTWALKQPPLVTYGAFACVGLGMAFPYLLVGAFPRLISFLPKPGDWMDTFKQLMGFVLIGTVVYILTYVRMPLVVPTVAFMMGLWAALWWVGRVPVWEDLNKRLRAWAVGIAFATLVGLISFSWLDDVMESRFQRDIDLVIASRQSNPLIFAAEPATRSGKSSELTWKPYSLALLSKAVLSEKKTVFIDFTADW